jgi:hypothetical protein
MYEYRNPISRVILTAVITILVIATSILPLTQHNAKAFSLLDAFKNLFKKKIPSSQQQQQPSPRSSSATNNVGTSSGKCDQSLWSHVYHPSRLQVVDPCKTVSGIIESKKVEKDGDYHIRLKADPQFANLVNSANIKGQLGDLVLEPICVNPVTQPDAVSACQNFHENISIPPVGSHVQVIGSYVLDNQHGGWAEIHPVTFMVIIP